MKVFVYNLREFDELAYFEEYSGKLGMEFGWCSDYPTMENVSLAAGYDAISIITSRIPAEMIDAFREKGVRVISTRTIGYDHIDITHAEKTGMGVCNLTYSSATVAEFAIMLMMIALRKLPYTMKRASIQDFRLEKAKLGRELSNCTVGIIGTGRIGREVIKELRGFGCRVLAYARHPDEDISKNEHSEYGDVSYVSFDELLENSDIISLHANVTGDSIHMLDDNAFERMKDRVIIINTARGQLLDTKALIRHLDSGKVGFAALDVIENEIGIHYNDLSGMKLPDDDIIKLKEHDNVLWTPHHAFYTEEAVSGMVENSLIAIRDYFEGNDNPFIICR